MNKPSWSSIPLLVSLLISCGAACAGEASPKQCERLEERIEKYTSLRRGGGSGAQMAAWKRARREAQAAYRDGNCRAHKRRMIRVPRSK